MVPLFTIMPDQVVFPVPVVLVTVFVPSLNCQAEICALPDTCPIVKVAVPPLVTDDGPVSVGASTVKGRQANNVHSPQCGPGTSLATVRIVVLPPLWPTHAISTTHQLVPLLNRRWKIRSHTPSPFGSCHRTCARYCLIA